MEVEPDQTGNEAGEANRHPVLHRPGLPLTLFTMRSRFESGKKNTASREGQGRRRPIILHGFTTRKPGHAPAPPAPFVREVSPPVTTSSNGAAPGSMSAERVDAIFGSDVFSPALMRQRLPKEIYRSLMRTIDQGDSLDPQVAGVV